MKTETPMNPETAFEAEYTNSGKSPTRDYIPIPLVPEESICWTRQGCFRFCPLVPGKFINWMENGRFDK